jgi:hypothetical protein
LLNQPLALAKNQILFIPNLSYTTQHFKQPAQLLSTYERQSQMYPTQSLLSPALGKSNYALMSNDHS